MIETIVLVITAFITSVLSAIIGMGGGITLLGVMAIVIPEGYMVVAFHGITQLVSNITRTTVYREHINKPILKKFFIGIIPGLVFAVLIIIVRNYPSIDIVPSQFVAGICCCLIGYFFSNKIMISNHDIFLGFLAGFFQIGFGFIFITIGARTTPSAMVGIIMLSESGLGPLWAFLFVSERPSIFSLIGGAIILFAVLIQFYTLLRKSEKTISN